LLMLLMLKVTIFTADNPATPTRYISPVTLLLVFVY